MTDIVFRAEDEDPGRARLNQWLVKVGDSVTEGTPVAEVETDKVTMEIVADADGAVEALLVEEGDSVEPGQVLGRLSSSQTAPGAAATADIIEVRFSPEDGEDGRAKLGKWLVAEGDSVSEGDAIAEVETDKVVLEIVSSATGILQKQCAAENDELDAGAVIAHVLPRAQEYRQPQSEDEPPRATPEPTASSPAGAQQRISPAVKSLMLKHQLDLTKITGSGEGGRVTRDDVVHWLENRPEEHASAGTTTVPHSPMRKAIAERMVESLLQISPHVTSVFEADLSAISAHRAQNKDAFAQKGVKLTYTAYFIAAACHAMKEVPQVNARFFDDRLEMYGDVHIGVGTALGDEGLVAPVLRNAHSMDLLALAKALQDQTERARAGRIKQAELKGGTFTISNHGVSGSLFASPIIISQPQVAILGIGKMEKRIKVETVDGEDAIRIRPMCYVTLSIDHRALDAFQTNRWLASFVAFLESYGRE